MLNFFVILTAVKHPNHWAVIMCVKKELIKGLLELMLDSDGCEAPRSVDGIYVRQKGIN